MYSRLVILLVSLLAQFAWAQAPQKLEPMPNEELEPQVTIRNKDEERVEEYRIRGRLYMIKITPKIGKPYYLVDQKGDGVFARYDGLDTGLKVPQWIIMSW